MLSTKFQDILPDLESGLLDGPDAADPGHVEASPQYAMHQSKLNSSTSDLPRGSVGASALGSISGIGSGRAQRHGS